jgi:hypothetical protein
MNKMKGFSQPLVVILLLPLTAGHAQEAGGSPDGYSVEQSAQSVQAAPPGWVGRKTTDIETRVGNTDATRGRARRSTLTVGTFVKECPTAEGRVEGNFEYSLTVDDAIDSEGEEPRREHYTQLLSAELTGQVRDDAQLDYVEYVARFTRSDRDVQSAPVVDSGRFTPGVDGSGDFSAMLRAVEKTSEIAFAMAIWLESPVFKAAEVEWQKLNKCVELKFDPATDTVALTPNEAKQVRAELHTKSTGEAVPWQSDSISTLGSAGTVSPSRVEAQLDAPATFTYTASGRPRRGDGFGFAARSRAGAGEGAWRIVRPRIEGTFTQTERQPQRGNTGAGSFEILQTTTVKGRLVWTPEAEQLAEGDLPHLPSFDVPSVHYVPTDGEISVDFEYDAKGANAVCRFDGSRVFPISAFSPRALGYLDLEVAADGRYKLSLGMLAGLLPVPVENRGCRMQVVMPLGVDSVWRDTAIVIGIHEGVIIDDRIEGELAPPIVVGPSTTTATWSFSKIEE